MASFAPSYLLPLSVANLENEDLTIGERTPTDLTSNADVATEVSWESDSEMAPTKASSQATLPATIPNHCKPMAGSIPQSVTNLEISRLNWKTLSLGKEWRRELMLRGLPHQFCDSTRLEAFLERQGLRETVLSIRALPGRSQRIGAAIVRANSAEAAAKLAKFFHGRQLPGSSMPVAVSFAENLNRSKMHSRRGEAEPMRVPNREMEPMRIDSSNLQGLANSAVADQASTKEADLPAVVPVPVCLELPPGLEGLLSAY